MKIETYLQSNCSDYTIRLRDLSKESAAKIKELESDLRSLWTWSASARKKLPAEPSLVRFTTQKWSDEWGKWKKLPNVIAFHNEDKKRWKALRKKYQVAGEDIFDTSIRGFKWHGNDLEIFGYLNEDVFVKWLEQVAKAEKIEVDNES